MEEKSIHRKDIVVGLGVGVGVGLFVLVAVLLLLRPSPETEPTPGVTLTFETLPTVPSASESLVLPSPTSPAEPAPTATSPPQFVTYTVKSGDVLSVIAYNYKTTVDAIIAANNLQGDVIYPDQELLIPLDAAAVAQLTATPPTAVPVTGDHITYTVKARDTLSEIAQKYGVTVNEIMVANGLTSDMIRIGDTLLIPQKTPSAAATPATTTTPAGTTTPTPTTTPTTTSTPTPEAAAPWVPAILEGDLDAAYFVMRQTPRFTLHYALGTYPAQDFVGVETMVSRALAHLESSLQTTLTGTFDVYVAGSLFAAPDTALRGRSFPAARRYFFLHDGAGNPADQQYIAARELTYLFMWNVFGRPASVLLSEGAATYMGMSLIADSSHIPLDTFCAAYRQAGKLPRVSTNLSFKGRLVDLPNYYAAGCFVQYLITTYGPEKFGQLYSSGNYSGVYGKSLTALEKDWLAAIQAANVVVPFEPAALVAAVNAVDKAYTTLFGNFSGTPAQMAAYLAVDAARIALLEGDFAGVDQHLADFRRELGASPF